MGQPGAKFVLGLETLGLETQLNIEEMPRRLWVGSVRGTRFGTRWLLE